MYALELLHIPCQNAENTEPSRGQTLVFKFAAKERTSFMRSSATRGGRAKSAREDAVPFVCVMKLFELIFLGAHAIYDRPAMMDFARARTQYDSLFSRFPKTRSNVRSPSNGTM